MIKSPLRYPGGKSRAMKFLKDFIPPFHELREPFFGGGSFSFYCVQEFPQAHFYASDANYELHCLWQQLRQNPVPLIEAVRAVKLQYSEEEGRTLYQQIMERRNDDLSDLQRAIDFFVLNRISFSGVADAGGYSNQAFLKRFTHSSIDRLEKAIAVAKKIQFLSGDYTQLLLEQKAPKNKTVFIFLDPPYYSATKSKLYGKKGALHTQFNHDEFCENMKKCPHQWLLTYDNCDYVRTKYADFYQVEWELQYGMNNFKQGKAARGKELLIANFELRSSK